MDKQIADGGITADKSNFAIGKMFILLAKVQSCEHRILVCGACSKDLKLISRIREHLFKSQREGLCVHLFIARNCGCDNILNLIAGKGKNNK